MTEMFNIKNSKDIALEEFEKEISNFNKGILIDMGCEDASLQNKFSTLGFSYVPIDISYSRGIMIGDMTNIPLAKDFAEMVFCCNSFEQCINPYKALTEFRRVLKGGGTLFMLTPYPCQEQIFKTDKNNVFVLNEMQLGRLLYVTGFVPIKIYILKNGINEKDWKIITIASVI